MAINYRRPGVYLQESVLNGSTDIGSAASVAVFVGAASQGPINEPVQLDSWTDYAATFGGFTPANGTTISYLPYAVFNYFQNGGATAYAVRSVDSDETGDKATYTVTDGTATNVLKVDAKSEGTWGNALKVSLEPQTSSGTLVFTVVIWRTEDGDDVEVERFTDLSIDGSVPGTKRPDSAINDPLYGSSFVTCSVLTTAEEPEADGTLNSLTSGADADAPESADLSASATTAVAEIEGPVILNIVGHDEDGTFVGGSINPQSAWPDRGDVFVIDDNFRSRGASETSSEYETALSGTLASTAGGSSYVAAYTPWIVVGDPNSVGSTITIPPGGAVAGVYARTDATRGVFRAPAGVLANLTNCLNVDANFSTSKQGQLNTNGYNVIRPVAGSGISVMGGRTRKSYGADRYVNARRTLIYIRESLKNSTQFAVFENNDQRLWTRLTSTADRILRPIWSEGGLRGSSAAEAYYIVCDDTVNTPPVISSGEVRMEIGVALEYPAEFIVIQLSQYEGGSDINIS